MGRMWDIISRRGMVCFSSFLRDVVLMCFRSCVLPWTRSDNLLPPATLKDLKNR